MDASTAFQPILTLDTTIKLWVWGVGTFNNMENDHHGVVHDCFLVRAGGISLPHEKLQFYTWMKVK